MKISKRFRDAIENSPEDLPDYVWLEYAVCALGDAPCGWTGWIVGATFKKTAQRYATSTGDKALSSDDTQICPSCRATRDGHGTLFRTRCARRLEVSANQEPPLEPGVAYQAGDIEYV